MGTYLYAIKKDSPIRVLIQGREVLAYRMGYMTKLPIINKLEERRVERESEKIARSWGEERPEYMVWGEQPQDGDWVVKLTSRKIFFNDGQNITSIGQVVGYIQKKTRTLWESFPSFNDTFGNRDREWYIENGAPKTRYL